MVKATELLKDRALLELMPTAVYVIDELGRIQSFNNKACEFWGRTPKLNDTDEKFCGGFKLFLSDGTYLPHDQTPMAKAVRLGESCRNVEVVIQREDGSEITVMVNISPLRDEQGRIVGAINAFQDVTEIVLARRKLEAQQQELERAVSARDTFLSICSHELKTPLTSLKFQTQLTKRKIAKNDESVFDRRAVIEMVEENDLQLIRLNRLVDDMLDLGRIQSDKLSMHPTEADLSAVVREVVTRCASSSDEFQSRIAVKTEPGIVGVFDAERFGQVVSNLIWNAFKYGNDRPIEVETRTDGSNGFFVIRDHGIGIAPADQERIFERFERAVSSRNVSGLGLGLFVSKQIVDAHGGEISLQSRPGEGSTFEVRLPLRGLPVSENAVT